MGITFGKPEKQDDDFVHRIVAEVAALKCQHESSECQVPALLGTLGQHVEGVRADVDSLKTSHASQQQTLKRIERLLQQLVSKQQGGDSANVRQSQQELAQGVEQRPSDGTASPRSKSSTTPSLRASSSSDTPSLSSGPRHSIGVHSLPAADPVDAERLQDLPVPELAAFFGAKHPEAVRLAAVTELERRLSNSSDRRLGTLQALVAHPTAFDSLVCLMLDKGSSTAVVTAALTTLTPAASEKSLCSRILASRPDMLGVLGEWMQDSSQLQRQELATDLVRMCCCQLESGHKIVLSAAAAAATELSLLTGISAVLQSGAASAEAQTDAARALYHVLRAHPAAKSHPAAQAAIKPLVQLLSDEDCSYAASTTLAALATGHVANQSLIGAEPGAISALVRILQPDSTYCSATMEFAADTLAALCEGHGLNQSRVLHEDNLLAALEGSGWDSSLVDSLRVDNPDFLLWLLNHPQGVPAVIRGLDIRWDSRYLKVTFVSCTCSSLLLSLVEVDPACLDRSSSIVSTEPSVAKKMKQCHTPAARTLLDMLESKRQAAPASFEFQAAGAGADCKAAASHRVRRKFCAARKQQ